MPPNNLRGCDMSHKVIHGLLMFETLCHIPFGYREKMSGELTGIHDVETDKGNVIKVAAKFEADKVTCKKCLRNY